jgi:phage shock protein PspC (stress-responsive transcriptional regulator)
MTEEAARRSAETAPPDDADTTAPLPSPGPAGGSPPPATEPRPATEPAGTEPLPATEPAGTEPPPAGPPPAAERPPVSGPPPGTERPPAGPPPPTDVPPPSGSYGPPGGTPFAERYGLVRPREGRYLAGVCAAIGRATNTDPLLWRVLLAVLGVFGGIGILLYVAAWLIIPAEGDTASPVESMLGRGRSSMSPVTVILLAVLIAVIFAFVVTDGFSSVLLATAILMAGALLLNREANRQRQAATGQPPYAQPPYAAGPPGASEPVGATSTLLQPTFPAATGAAQPPHPAAEAPTQAFAAPSGPAPQPAAAEQWGFPESASVAPAYPAPPGSPGGYRPPFAPRGPYAGGPPYPPPPPVAPPPPPPPPRPPRERSPLGAATFSMIFVVLGLIAALDLADVVPIGPSAYFAGVLVTAALGLLVGAWVGRARWLIAIGLVAALALGISTLAESPGIERLEGGPVTWRPTTVAELNDRYENNFGDATLDLRAVDLGAERREITAQVNFGRLVVLVPQDADVTAIADVNAGDARVFGQQWSGMHGSGREVTDLGPDGRGGGELQLFLHVNAGELEVQR